MKKTRRDFLIKSASVTSYGLISSFLPFMPSAFAQMTKAQGTDDHFFVLIHGGGAMDVTCGLDPQVLNPGSTPEDLFLEYSPKDIIRTPTMALGPTAASFLPHLKDIAIINGVVMSSDGSDLGHPASSEYITSGKSDGSGTALPAEIAADTSAGPLGVISSNQGAFQISAGAKKSVFVTDINGLGSDGSSYAFPLNARNGMLAMLASKETSEEFRRPIGSIDELSRAIESYNTQMQNYRSQTNGNITPIYNLAAAINSGASKQLYMASYGYGGQIFDTHGSDHVGNHAKAQSGFYENVSNLFTLFKNTPYKNTNDSLFSKTTFMVCSEFSRTPALNSARGKDHNLETNSVLLAGKGIRGNTTVGASIALSKKEVAGDKALPRHIGAPFDFKTQTAVDFNRKDQIERLQAQTDIIRPENVAVTLKEVFKIPTADFNGAFSGIKPLKKVIKA